MLEVVTKIDAVQWEDLSRRSSYNSFFQTKECYDFYDSLSFLKAVVFGVKEDNELKGLICGYLICTGNLIKCYLSRRVIIPGGPLLADDISDNALGTLLVHAKKMLRKKAIYIEIRNYHDYSPFKHIFKQNGFEYQPYLNFLVDTSSVHGYNLMNESKRRQIKKAKNAGVSVSETHDLNDINAFYTILSRLYKYEVKKPLFPKSFFEKLVTLPNAHLFVAKFHGKIIGGIACVAQPGHSVYEWYICGDKQKYNRLYPSVAVTNAAIQYAAQNGYKTFDFMGAGKPDEPYGVRDFKKKFGGELVEYGRFLCINNFLLYQLGVSVIKCAQKIIFL